MIDCETETPNELAQILHVGPHLLHADGSVAAGGKGAAPSPHDYFDAALAACKAITVSMYAKAHGIPLERIESHVDRDDSKERQGVYVLNVRLVFQGNLTDEQRERLHAVSQKCPVHKLMTTTEIRILTEPLTPPP